MTVSLCGDETGDTQCVTVSLCGDETGDTQCVTVSLCGDETGDTHQCEFHFVEMRQETLSV